MINISMFAVGIQIEYEVQFIYYAIFNNFSSFQCVPFWPVQSCKNQKLIAKVDGSDYNTEPFYFCKPHTTFMKVEDQVVTLFNFKLS